MDTGKRGLNWGAGVIDLGLVPSLLYCTMFFLCSLFLHPEAGSSEVL
jgi:hypothetical protein